MRNREPYYLESRLSAIEFDVQDFEEFDPSNCRPYFFSDHQIALLCSLMRYAEWEARWTNGEVDWELVGNTNRELMSACNELTLIRQQVTRIANAMYGAPDTTQVYNLVTEALIIDDQDTSVGKTLSDMAGATQDYSDELVEIAGNLVTLAALV